MCIINDIMLNFAAYHVFRLFDIVFYENFTMVSVDVVRILTNVPHTEACDPVYACVCGERSARKPPHELKHQRAPVFFLRLVESFCTVTALFKQVHGVVMGSPWGPTHLRTFFGDT